MSLRFFDCNASIGLRLGAAPGEPTTVAELLEEMDRLEITGAVVHHFSGFESEPLLGNLRVDEEVGDHPRLIRAWTALPDTGGDMPPATEFVDQLVRLGARAVSIFPKRMNWCLEEWCAGSLLSALEDRRVPVLMPLDQTDLLELHRVLETHPRLPVVITAVSYRLNRMLLPLLLRHCNLFIDTSPTFAIHEGIEQVCSIAGARHLVFGTGYPKHEPGASVTQIMYANISEEERASVAAGNMERLIREVAV